MRDVGTQGLGTQEQTGTWQSRMHDSLYSEACATTLRRGMSESVTGQRSNQLNYVPNLFSYLYRKPASLVAFLRFNRFACVACFNPVETGDRSEEHTSEL